MPAGVRAPVAFCAPGGRFAAALVLAFAHQDVAEICEHPFLAGSDEVVVADVPELRIDPSAFRVVHPEPMWPLISGLLEV